ncbi:MAG: hypothetical protein D6675_08455 [Gemmatimonadetes bacterium]|nr:MAG: hypothetical protein D6675_08455 [Gemmatimonadota bacterium]
MGLSIHYQFKLDTDLVDNACVVVEQLRDIAAGLPFRHVTEVIHLQGEQCDPDRRDAFTWLKVQAQFYLPHGGHYLKVAPDQLIGFAADPGEGSEKAHFGLCRYPQTVTVADETIATGLDGWQWQSACKTQYASDPRYGGSPNFLQAHLLVVAVLDVAQKLGILQHVDDEGGYWEHRDSEQLVEKVHHYNQLVAGMVGALSDAGQDVGLAPILAYPNFEHLEAKGYDSLRKYAFANFKTSLEQVLQTFLRAIEQARSDRINP